ncbi:DNA-binding protein DDB_G0278111-like isoform X1 [Panicum virgatum]|uniref:DNA-binding protein DDB_G0278111-like isoform X1 n=1 Tax=Panicum virgatum TaxID=38727 RepID=UPI0019D60563|nr:DNA-binding protein DDB_G0278111-like isoform X1 [Panicum virgatum]
MADPELEAIRQRRMQELMAQRGGANQQNASQQKAQEDAKQEAEERRQMMLAQILSSEARERLSRIALVKPDKARGVEDVLLRAAQTGGISEKVSEERLISLLEQINTQTTKQTKVTVVSTYFYKMDLVCSRKILTFVNSVAQLAVWRVDQYV